MTLSYSILYFNFLGTILNEVGLHQLSSLIPTSINYKPIGNDLANSRDPTLVPPKNTIQSSIQNLPQSQSQENIFKNSKSSSLEKNTLPQATKNIYQAFKRGLRRLSSLRRNNSA